MNSVPISMDWPHNQPKASSSMPSRHEAPSTEELFDFPDADIILRSSDSRDFRVLKLFITKCSPVLDKLIQTASDSAGSKRPITKSSPVLDKLTRKASDSALSLSAPSQSTAPLPVIHMSESGAILRSLLSFLFPTPPVLPSTVEGALELLSVATKYEMNHVLTHIRGSMALQDPPLICGNNALHVYSLAQTYGLRQEVVQAARLTVRSVLTVENLKDQLDVMHGVHLHELWNYHRSLQEKLKSHVDGFRRSSAYTALYRLSCPTHYEVPKWIDDYINLVVSTPSSLDNFEHFHFALVRLLGGKDNQDQGKSYSLLCTCTEKAVDEFWTGFTAFVNANVEEAESAFSMSDQNTSSKDHIGFAAVPLPLPECLDVKNADVVLQSSDSANFRVHKAVLASSSQFFRDMFSPPRPSKDETIDGLPFVRLSEDAELVRALITVMYPIPTELPASYERILALLAAAQKYNMSAIQSSIRAEITRKDLPALTRAQSFRAYAIAFDNNLIPEMGSTARLTLDYPLTFEMLGDDLRLFSGPALRELAGFRKTCSNNITSCLLTFLDAEKGPSNIWVGCPKPRSRWQASAPSENDRGTNQTLPRWLYDFFLQQIIKSEQSHFTEAVVKPSSIREMYLDALMKHSPTPNDCPTCLMVHAHKGEKYCAGLEQKLTHARNQASNVFRVNCGDSFVLLNTNPSTGTSILSREKRTQILSNGKKCRDIITFNWSSRNSIPRCSSEDMRNTVITIEKNSRSFLFRHSIMIPSA